MGRVCRAITSATGMRVASATSCRSGPSYTTGMRCRRPGISIFGRFAASRLIAPPSDSCVVCSGSKCTVTLAYAATAWRTSRRLRSAAPSAIARVFSAVSRRDPSSATRAVSPSGWIRILCVERAGGMRAHKDRVEDAGREPDAEERRARKADGPRRDNRGDRHIPGGEIAAHRAQRAGVVEERRGRAARGEPRHRVRHHEQHRDAPWQRNDERRRGGCLDVEDRTARAPQRRRVECARDRDCDQDERSSDDGDRSQDAHAIGKEAPAEPPGRRSVARGAARACDRVTEDRDHTERQQRDRERPGHEPPEPPAAKRPAERTRNRAQALAATGAGAVTAVACCTLRTYPSSGVIVTVTVSYSVSVSYRAALIFHARTRSARPSSTAR